MNVPRIHPILTDHLGTPRKVLDGGSGEVRWDWDAKDPFGHQAPNETPTSGFVPFSFELRFPGQRHDPALGLYHNGFRDYHAGLGRYVQSDPLGLEAGWNTYGYVGATPTSRIDSFGLSEQDVVRIRERLDFAVRVMTQNGFRHGDVKANDYSGFWNAYKNNIRASWGRIIKSDSQKLGFCREQADNVMPYFYGIDLDDTWVFFRVYNGRHHWIHAVSSNPKDSMLVVDPWVNHVKPEKSVSGITYAGARFRNLKGNLNYVVVPGGEK